MTDACRAGCGACCIAPSITSPLPGMPEGKPAGVRCAQLDDANLCRLFGDPRRPALCARFTFDAELCGEHRHQALTRIAALEVATGAGESAAQARPEGPAGTAGERPR